MFVVREEKHLSMPSKFTERLKPCRFRRIPPGHSDLMPPTIPT
jgi:hypothetical protein